MIFFILCKNYRASAYINQYNSATLNLTLVASRILSYPTLGVIDLTPLQQFIQDIQATLNSNVQELTVKYSPSNVQSFILGYYQNFLTNLLLNNGWFANWIIFFLTNCFSQEPPPKYRP